MFVHFKSRFLSKSKTFNNLDLNHVLPPNVLIYSVDSYFHRLGLFSDKNLHFIPKKPLFYPKFVFGIQSIAMISLITSLFVSENHLIFLAIIGNVGHFIGVRTHITISALFCLQLSVALQIIHYYNGVHHIRPSYLEIFRFISGKVSAKNVKLDDKNDVRRLLILSQILFYLSDFVPIFAVIIALTITLGLYIPNFPLIFTLTLGIMNSIRWGLTFYYSFYIIMAHVLYFSIIAYYIRIKIKRINRLLNKCLRIREIYSLHEIYQEIDKYNKELWSKFLFVIWLSVTILTSALAYILIFADFDIMQRTMFLVGTSILTFFLLVMIFTSSSVHSEVNKSYKLLNCRFVSFKSHPIVKLKVRLIQIFN